VGGGVGEGVCSGRVVVGGGEELSRAHRAGDRARRAACVRQSMARARRPRRPRAAQTRWERDR
jgi:hypothetical protein